MKHLFYLMTAFLLIPVSVSAQDDMYFTPKKQKRVQASETTSGLRTYDKDDVIYNGGNVVKPVPADTIYAGDEVENDTLYIDEYQTFEDGNGGRWINGFKGDAEDYKYAMKNFGWRSLTTAVPIGSYMYWNLTTGPASFDWNVYEVGGLAYMFPTWSNPLYWDYRISPSWGAWGWHRPWGWHHSWYFGHSYAWGGFYDPWYSPWYDPFYYGGYWGIGHVHWGISWGGHWGGFHPNFAWTHRRTGRSNAGYTIGGKTYRIGDRETARTVRSSRTEVGTRVGTHRVQDRANARREQDSRVTGRSMRSTVDGTRSSGSVRSTSSYSRSADGRNSTYSRPSSTRSSSMRGTDGTTRSTVRSIEGSSSRSVQTDRSSGRSQITRSRSYESNSRSSYDRSSSSRSSFGGGSSYSGGSRSEGSYSGGGRSSGGGRGHR